MNAVPTASSDPQHLRALARANEIRLARAELKRGVAQGRVSAADVIIDCPWEAQSMTVADVLMSQRRWGLTRCRKVLFALQLSELKTVGTLTERQRNALAGRLRTGGAGEPALAFALA